MKSIFGRFKSLGWQIAGLMAVVVAMGSNAVATAQQHVFAPVGPTGALDTTWAGGPNFAGPFNLGNAPTGTWTSAFIAIDYTGSSAAADQWSNEARTALHSAAWDNFLNLPGSSANGPANAGTVYWAASGAASGSAANTAARNDLYWSVANLSNSIVSDGNQAVFLSSRQTYGGGGASATHANIRVVLNPNIRQSGLGTGLALPSAFTDMGTFAVGNTSVDVTINNTQTGADGISWLRFQVNQDVTADHAFDLFTGAGATGTTDPRVTLFRNTATGLFAVASTDDMGTVQAGLTFGSDDIAGFSRDTYGVAAGDAAFFNGRGGTLELAALNDFGYYSGTAGNARLMAGEEYFLAVSHWSGTAPFVTNSGLEITNDEVILGALNMGIGNPGTALGEGNVVLSFRSVPEPGSLAFVAIAGASVLFRRRRS